MGFYCPNVGEQETCFWPFSVLHVGVTKLILAIFGVQYQGENDTVWAKVAEELTQ